MSFSWTMKISRMLFSPMMLLVTGCASDVSQGVASTGTTAPAQLIIYRPAANLFSFMGPMVKIDGSDSCAIGNGTAFQTIVPAGVVNLSSSDYAAGVLGTSKFSFTASAGQVYYVRFSINQAEAYAAVGGSVAGEALEQVFAKQSGPFDIALTDRSAMGGLKPQICTS